MNSVSYVYEHTMHISHKHTLPYTIIYTYISTLYTLYISGLYIHICINRYEVEIFSRPNVQFSGPVVEGGLFYGLVREDRLDVQLYG